MTELSVDLRDTESGCKDHPLVVLGKILRDFADDSRYTRLVVLARKSDIPVTLIKLLVARLDLALEKLYVSGDELRVVVRKVFRSWHLVMRSSNYSESIEIHLNS